MLRRPPVPAAPGSRGLGVARPRERRRAWSSRRRRVRGAALARRDLVGVVRRRRASPQAPASRAARAPVARGRATTTAGRTCVEHHQAATVAAARLERHRRQKIGDGTPSVRDGRHGAVALRRRRAEAEEPRRRIADLARRRRHCARPCARAAPHLIAARRRRAARSASRKRCFSLRRSIGGGRQLQHQRDRLRWPTRRHPRDRRSTSPSAPLAKKPDAGFLENVAREFGAAAR